MYNMLTSTCMCASAYKMFSSWFGKIPKTGSITKVNRSFFVPRKSLIEPWFSLKTSTNFVEPISVKFPTCSSYDVNNTRRITRLKTVIIFFFFNWISKVLITCKWRHELSVYLILVCVIKVINKSSFLSR